MSDDDVPIADLFAGAGDKLMLATRRVGSTTFDLLATIGSNIFIPLQTAPNTTVVANGAGWYKNGRSMGFAGETDTINQSSADINGQSERDRLSWHTNVGGDRNDAASFLSGGWRSGDNTDLNSSDEWERLVLTANVTPEARVRTKEVGMRGFLGKPVTVDGLRNCILSVLNASGFAAS
ncbi:MAG: hypothetical protein R3210_05670, partial [Roseovarius sp.]|nr:hypothetical protein [Roseovarius sp.]